MRASAPADPAREAGATLVEYAMLVGVVVLVLIGSISAFGDAIEGSYAAQRTAIAADPGFVAPPTGSGGPGDPVYEQFPPPADDGDDGGPDDDGAVGDDGEDGDDGDPEDDGEDGDDRDGEPDEDDEDDGEDEEDGGDAGGGDTDVAQDPLQVTFGSPTATTSGQGANATWSVDLALVVNRPDGTVLQVELSPAPAGGSPSVSCVVSEGSCSLRTGPWDLGTGQGQGPEGSGPVRFTVPATGASTSVPPP